MTTYSVNELKAIDNLKPGMVVWKVHGFVANRQSSVSELIILEEPKPSILQSLFMVVRDVDYGYSTEISLNDAGFPSGNSYNDHKLFFSEFDANAYAAAIVSGNVSSRIRYADCRTGE